MLEKLWEARKAIIAFVFALIAALAGVVDDGLTWGEALGAIAFAGTAAGITWAVPNKNYRKGPRIEIEP